MSRALLAAFADDVARGLAERPKRIPPAWLVDAEGARLRGQAAQEPECYFLRTELAILAAQAEAMLPPAREPLALVALGAGEAPRVRLVADALQRRQGRVVLHPVDVRDDALRSLAHALQGSPGLRVRPLHGQPGASLRAMPRDGPRLVLLLGARLTQLGPEEGARFLADVRAALAPGDTLLCTTDTMKDPDLLVRARADAAGWTRAQHLHLLARMNQDLGAQFDPAQFTYEAVWDARGRRVRMSLVSLIDQEVRIRALRRTFRFAAGEPLRTEDAHAFLREDVTGMAHRACLQPEQSWTDADGWVAVHRLGVRPAPPA